MRFKRFVSAMLIASICSSLVLSFSTFVSAAYNSDWGNYPDHPTLTGPLFETTETVTDAVIGQTPAANVFEVDGRSFILLDKNANGDYFVMANEVYGQMAERDVASDADLSTLTIADWGFDPSATGSLAHKMNDETSGLLSDSATGGIGGSSMVIPSSMVDYIKTTNWEIEPFYPRIGGSSANKPNAQAWVDARIAETPYQYKTVSAKLAHMSYTEYMYYADKIGITLSGGSQIYLRTPFAYVVGKNGGAISFTGLGNMVVKLNNAGDEVQITYSKISDASDIYTRPVMWLEKDFFKNVEIDIDNAGQNVKDEIKASYEYSDMAEIYGADKMFDFYGKTRTWAWGNYPAHPQTTTILHENNPYTAIGGKSVNVGDSDPTRTFTIDGRRFILLDRNAKGEYFIMADESYGLMDNTSYENLDSTLKAWEVGFRPDAEGQFGYYLNDETFGFLSGSAGNALSWGSSTWNGAEKGQTMVLPQAIIDNLVEKAWEIEPVYHVITDVYSQRGIAAGGEFATEHAAWVNSQTSDPNNGYRTVTAKVAPISLTEYKQYANIIGVKSYELGERWRSSSYMRTQAISSGAKMNEDGTYSITQYKLSPLSFYRHSNSNNGTVYIVPVSNVNQYHIRPVMWLKEGFFLNNKIDIDTAGSTVLLEMRSEYTPVKLLAAGYTIDEINTIYATNSAKAEYTNVNIKGTPIVGSKVSLNYKYTGTSAEGATEVYWVASSTENGTYSPIGQTGKELVIDSSLAGKYIKAMILPKNASGDNGTIVYSSASKVLADDGTIIVTANNTTASTVSINLKNTSTSGLSAYYMVITYSGGIMNAVQPETVTFTNREATVNVPLSGEMAVIVLNEDYEPIALETNGIATYWTDKDGITEDLTTSKITVAKTIPEAKANKIVVINMADSNGTAQYIGAAYTYADGKVVTEFALPSTCTSDDYTISYTIFGGTVADDTFFYTNVTEANSLVTTFKDPATDVDDIKTALDTQMGLLQLPQDVYDSLDETTYDGEGNVVQVGGKDAVAQALYDNKDNYNTAGDVAQYVEDILAENAFRCADTATEIKDLLDEFEDVYNINSSTSKCYDLFEDMTDEEQEDAMEIMANIGTNNVIKSYDQAILLTEINNATQPSDITALLEDDGYRGLIDGFTNYSDYDADTLGAHLYSAESNFTTIADLTERIATCAEKSTSGGTPQGPGDATGTPGGTPSGVVTGNGGDESGTLIPTPSTDTPVNNEGTSSFNDVPVNHWAKKAVDYLVENDIAAGVGGGNFGASDNITREQFVLMLVKGLNLKYNYTMENPFTDIEEGHWAYDAVMVAYHLGVVSGISEDKFGVGQNITRQDMAVMAFKALLAAGNAYQGAVLTFADRDTVAPYAESAISVMSANKMIGGYPDNTYRPLANSTRAEAAQIIYNILTTDSVERMQG